MLSQKIDTAQVMYTCEYNGKFAGQSNLLHQLKAWMCSSVGTIVCRDKYGGTTMHIPYSGQDYCLYLYWQAGYHVCLNLTDK